MFNLLLLLFKKKGIFQKIWKKEPCQQRLQRPQTFAKIKWIEPWLNFKLGPSQNYCGPNVWEYSKASSFNLLTLGLGLGLGLSLLIGELENATTHAHLSART